MQAENRVASGPGLYPGLQTLGVVSSTYENLGARLKTSATLSPDALQTDPPVVFTENAINTGFTGRFASRAAAHAWRLANALRQPNEGLLT